MGIHIKTIEKLEDPLLCERVLSEIKNKYSRRYIEKKHNVTRRQIDQIIRKAMN